MLKQLIITITALVLTNSVINLALADEGFWWDEAYSGQEISGYDNIYFSLLTEDSQNGYDSTQKGNENTKKDIIVATNRVNDQYSGHYDSTISLDERMEAWEWF